VACPVIRAQLGRKIAGRAGDPHQRLQARQRTHDQPPAVCAQGGTGYAPDVPKRPLVSWALSPQAVEAIRAQMLVRVKRREAILAHRDRTIVSLQYGLATRNQEVWGLRWLSLDGEFAWITEVLSSGQLEQWGKTERSTQRRTFIPSILREDLDQWRATLTESGRAAGDTDFIIPGDLTSPEHGVREVETGACHLSKAQAKIWGADCFTPAVRATAERREFARILGATPYALRRGGISLRLRTEDPQTVASECGTSLKMLSDHYSFPIEDLRQHEPRPADIEWRAARASVQIRSKEQEHADASSIDADLTKKPRWWSLRPWGATRRSI
jgi:hypothetical protein